LSHTGLPWAMLESVRHIRRHTVQKT